MNRQDDETHKRNEQHGQIVTSNLAERTRVDASKKDIELGSGATTCEGEKALTQLLSGRA